MPRLDRLICFAVLSLLACTFSAAAAAEPGYVNIRDHLPDTWPTDGSVDLKEQIQRVLDEHPMVFFPGSNDPKNPLVYPTTTGLIVPTGSRLVFAPHTRLLRLPSEGHILTLKDGVHLRGAVIDGNKYAHWPEFQDLGKTDSAIHLHNRCVVEDVAVFNNPGIAFFSYGSYNKVYRCLAENVGYIDVKFGADFYQGKWDKWSADGFYFRGTGNLIKDCEAYDCIRWDYVASHSGARQNTFVDCKGADINWRTYGFIDIEGADANNRLIRCVSPNSHISIAGSPHTEVIDCVASYISAYDHQNPKTVEMYGYRLVGPKITGCITTEGGIVLGGYSTLRGKHIPGAVAPIVTHNRMYKSHPRWTSGYSDWSFSVHSIDGHGIVANNILYEYEDENGRGPGMKLDNIEGTNNQILHGQWDLGFAIPKLTYAQIDQAAMTTRAREVARQALEAFKADHEIEGEIDQISWLPIRTDFLQDFADRGEAEGWAKGLPKQAGKPIQLSTAGHWSNRLGHFQGPGWYYFSLVCPDISPAQKRYLYFSAIDSEAKMYLNGELLGTHSGWNTPALLPLPESLADTRHQLAVKVWKPGSPPAGMYGPAGVVVMSSRSD